MTESEMREAITRHAERGQAQVAELASRGVAPDVPRPIRHAFRTPGREAAELLQQGLVYRGFRAEAGEGTPPTVLAETFWPPSVAADPRHVETFVRLASIHACEYCGWETTA